MVTIEIDRNRCEGKADCLAACPEDVFELQEPDCRELSLTARLKLRFHGGKQAFAVQADSCTACMACVDACPERAITVTETAAAGLGEATFPATEGTEAK